MWGVAWWGLGAVLTLLTATWVASVVRRDASLVDRVWGLAFVVLVWVYVWRGDGTPARGWLVGALVTVWGLRLAGYVTWRNWGEGEDARYQAMRRRNPERFAVRSLATIFWAQGLLAWIISAPLLVVGVDRSPAELTWVDAIAVAVWAVGLFFEAVGDAQLARFLADPSNRGTVMNRGLWRYTRHPNYFGDTTVWWGFGLFAVAAGGWWALVGPAVMTVFLVRVSGVALTEKRMQRPGGKRAGYDEYVARTSAFVPWFPKRS